MNPLLFLPILCLAIAQEAQPTTTPSPADDNGQPLSYGGGPSYAQPQYGPPPFFGPIFVPPNYDLNYCSVHASFPMVGLHRRHHHRDHSREHGRHRRQAYGGYQQGGYGGAVVGAAPVPAISNSLYSPSAAAQPAYGQPGYGQASYAQPGYPSYYPHARHRYYERHSCRYTATFSQETCQTCCRIASRNANTAASEITGALFNFDPDTKGDTMPNPETQCVCCAPKKSF
ncbi:unnamed protein product, partial [Mesorhabditis belari]|uniref:Uncharacterized protein n=1 Tax=Mesorhabditis belari TaxID=2138241 RepID=A0AAF3FME7_9BILA